MAEAKVEPTVLYHLHANSLALQAGEFSRPAGAPGCTQSASQHVPVPFFRITAREGAFADQLYFLRARPALLKIVRAQQDTHPAHFRPRPTATVAGGRADDAR